MYFINLQGREIWDSISNLQLEIIKNVGQLIELHSGDSLAYFTSLLNLETLVFNSSTNPYESMAFNSNTDPQESMAFNSSTDPQESMAFNSSTDPHESMAFNSSTDPQESMAFNSSTDPQNKVGVCLYAIHAAFKKIRIAMKKMGELAGVDIEPDQQTELLDKCQELSGVLIAGVPGAGGFDAIFCITIGEQSRENVLRYWETLDGDCIPLLASNETTGVRIESYNGDQ
jgi:phosphomevalonate kinase